MATSTLNVGIPPFMALTNNAIIQFEAISTTTGAVVSGVAISNASLFVETDNQVTEIDFVPTYVPVSIEPAA
jgi:hypothetical protein